MISRTDPVILSEKRCFFIQRFSGQDNLIPDSGIRFVTTTLIQGTVPILGTVAIRDTL